MTSVMKTLFVLSVIFSIAISQQNTDATYDETGQYFVSSFNATWAGAQIFCDDIGFGLLNVETEEENDYVLSIFTDIPSRVWIGGTDILNEGKFYWSQSLQPLNYSAWHDGEPSGTNPNTGVAEDCVIYWNTNGTTLWNDVPCINEYVFICEAMENNK